MYLLICHKKQQNEIDEGKYTIPMDPKTMKHEGLGLQYMGHNP